MKVTHDGERLYSFDDWVFYGNCHVIYYEPEGKPNEETWSIAYDAYSKHYVVYGMDGENQIFYLFDTNLINAITIAENAYKEFHKE